MAKTVDYNWIDFESDVARIKEDVLLSKYNTIVGISKGGLPLAVKLSNLLDIPMKIIEACSYENKKKCVLSVEQYNCLPWKNPILLVDDIVDSGITLSYIKDQLEIRGRKVDTLALFYKKRSMIKPDYFLRTVPNKTWVVLPWE